MSSEGRPPAIDPRHVVDRHTLDMLVCPFTKTRLTLSEDGSELISIVAQLAFPIRMGVPMLCIDEARELSGEEIDRLKYAERRHRSPEE